jgi:hypothetical protein
MRKTRRITAMTTAAVLISLTIYGATKNVLTLERTFTSVQLDERDLAYLAGIVQKLAVRSGGQIEIEVKSGDKQQSIKTTDPNFLESVDMPTEVSSVEMSYQSPDLTLPPQISVTLEIGNSFGNRLSVSGTDETAVSGTYEEIARELDQRRAFGVLPSTSLLNLGFLLIAYVLCLAAEISLLTRLGRLWPSIAPWKHRGAIPELTTPNTRLMIWIMVLIPLLVAFLLMALMREAFPAARFAGRLSDTGATARFWLGVIALSIILPTALEVVYDYWRYAKPPIPK